MDDRRTGILVLVGALLAGIGAGMPWVTFRDAFSSESVGGMDRDGILVLGAAIVGFLVGLAFLGAVAVPVSRMVLAGVAGAAGGVLLFVGITDYMDLQDIIEGATALVSGRIGAGLYMTIAGGALLLLAAVLRAKSGKEEPEPAE